MRKLDYGGAIREAMAQEMERDERVFVYGIGVPTWSSIFGTTKGLPEKFGPERCFDTPISEDAMTGFGLGAAIRGLRPIHVHIRVDFMILATNQLINMVSNYTYSTGGKLKVPLVVRAVIGRGWGQGAQHCKSLFSNFTHIPGLKVIAPTTPSDMKGMLTAAIRDDNPVICFEHRWLYWAEENVPEEPYEIPLGFGRPRRKDVTVVGLSWMNVEARLAADILARRGVSVEIVDPRTLAPLDEDLIVELVKRTGRCIIADCDWIDFGLQRRAVGAHQREVLRQAEGAGQAHRLCPNAGPHGARARERVLSQRKDNRARGRGRRRAGSSQSRRRGLLQPRAALPGAVLAHARIMLLRTASLRLAQSLSEPEARGPEEHELGGEAVDGSRALRKFARDWRQSRHRAGDGQAPRLGRMPRCHLLAFAAAPRCGDGRAQASWREAALCRRGPPRSGGGRSRHGRGRSRMGRRADPRQQRRRRRALGKEIVEDTDMRVWGEVYEKNAMAAVRFTRRALPHMRRGKWGRVVTITSIYGGKEGIGRPWFTMAKAAETGL